MTINLFTEWTIRGVTLRNRIVMSPMCMYSSMNKDGHVTDWHKTHYASRAAGGVGLILVEATAVTPDGRISTEDLGIWTDEHVTGLRGLTAGAHENGAAIGIQLAHAGRKSKAGGRVLAPSSIAFDHNSLTPEAMSLSEIQDTVEQFRAASIRAKEAGFDVIELHAAHGYLLNSFLSPLTNHRKDEYGSTLQGRFRLIGDVIRTVREVWQGPLFLRMSLDEYAPGGSTMEDFIFFAEQAKSLGVDLIDCSSGGVVPAGIKPYPGYQVAYAEAIRRAAHVPVGAVGLISEPAFAEYLVAAGKTDLVLLGRELLRSPYWPQHAAKALGAALPVPRQYERGW